MDKLIIYVDMDDVLCDFTKAYSTALTLHPKQIYPQSQLGFFQNLLPINGAVESVKFLSSHENFEVYILSAPSIKNPHSYTEKRLWVEHHFGLDMVKKLIINNNKGLNKGDFLIDDFIEGRGQENFKGKIIHFGSVDFPDWEKVMLYFKKNGYL